MELNVIRCVFSAFFLLCISLPTQAAIKVATASNFKVPLTEIIALYEQQFNHKVLISSGSTGVLYNQIKHGAPFDLFLSADSERAELIELSKHGVDGSRFTYAQGALAFWLPNSNGPVTKQSLQDFKGRVAIANPKLAPYGLAAKQSLQSLALWNHFSYIQGNNIAQTYQFVDTGNIDAGFVAYSLLLQNNQKNYYLLPIESYQPILQQGVVLNSSSNKQQVKTFVTFLQSDLIQQLIREKGYL